MTIVAAIAQRLTHELAPPHRRYRPLWIGRNSAGWLDDTRAARLAGFAEVFDVRADAILLRPGLDLFAALGSGSINSSQIMLRLSGEWEPAEGALEVLPPRKISSVSINVLGVGDLLTRLASCCHPLPGDKIIGYITQGRGITVHRKDCPNIVHEEEKERLVKVEWGTVGQVYPVMIQVDVWDRVGLVRDISAIIAEEGVNLSALSADNHRDDSVTLHFTLEVKSAAQVSKIMSRIRSVWNVVSVTRKGEISVS